MYTNLPFVSSDLQCLISLDVFRISKHLPQTSDFALVGLEIVRQLLRIISDVDRIDSFTCFFCTRCPREPANSFTAACRRLFSSTTRRYVCNRSSRLISDARTC